MITVTAYEWVPPFAHGLARDLRVRWALEEADLTYRTKLIAFEHRLSAEHRAHQPFGKIPVYEEDGLVLFESGAILLHIGERSAALLPADPAGKARAVVWLLAALNTVEPPVLQLGEIDLFNAGRDWAKQRRPAVEKVVRQRLADLAGRLGDRDYLEDRFTVGDLMMTTVLRALRHTDLVAEVPALEAYQARCEARPAFRRALSDHMAVYEAAGAAG